MDFVNRVIPSQPPVQRPVPGSDTGEPVKSSGHTGRGRSRDDLLAVGMKVGSNALLFVVALLIAAVAWLLYSENPTPQSHYINSSKLQAVFLNTGQVYFGNLQALNRDYMVLTNVYYLQSSNSNSSSTSSQSQNVSLVKLGCELHAPYDQMIVNTTQVTFWENLQSTGQVAKAVSQFQQQNPNGQNCSNQPAPSSSSSNLQNQK